MLTTREETFEDILKERKITQTELAKQAGISASILSNFKHGKPIRTDNLEAICKVLDVTADYLLGLSEISTHNPDIQSAHKLTGLSEKALANIAVLKDYPTSISGLNCLLTAEQTQLFGLAQAIYDYRKALRRIKQKGKKTVCTISKGENHLTGITEDRLYMISAMMAFQGLLETVGE